MPKRRAIDERTCAASRLLPFDFAALDRLFRQSLEGGLLLKREPKRLHVTAEAALLVSDRGQRGVHTLAVPAECRPVRPLMDVLYSPHNVRRL